MEKDLNESVQIIKHPCYQSYDECLLSWFDIRVFYVRVNSFMVDGCTPEYLTLNHIPLDPDTVLEVNGKRCNSCRLRRSRVDKQFEEATFVSTDSIRLSGSVKLEVFDGEDLILSGALEIFNEKGNGFGKWSLSCKSMPPMIKVYVAGSFLGTPIILTKTLQISIRKKQYRKGMLDSIPEYETTESRKDVAHRSDLQMVGYSGYESSLYLNQTEYMEGEDGALSWFNAGVRVGVGIGVGVGLLVRTYQSTTRNFRRRF